MAKMLLVVQSGHPGYARSPRPSCRRSCVASTGSPPELLPELPPELLPDVPPELLLDPGPPSLPPPPVLPPRAKTSPGAAARTTT
jgi:hypothetical protein